MVAYEKVTLYGVPIVSRRKVAYGRIDPELSRELFIRHALVEGDWDTHHDFFHRNQALRAELEELEHRTRRRDLIVDDEVLFDFYDRRLPPEIVSAAHFDRWWKQTRRTQPDLLTLTPEVLLNPDADQVREADYPDVWPHGDVKLPLTYQFEPGTAADGVTVHVPLTLLDQAAGVGLDWQVPGLRRDLVIALLRSLPKPLRRQLVPAPDVADDLLTHLTPYQGALTDALARELRRYGVAVTPDTFDLTKVPDHLRITIRVTDEHERTLAEGKDLAELRTQLRPHARASLAAAAASVEQRGLRTWTIGELSRRLELTRGSHTITGYPALVDTGDAVDVRVFPTEREQQHHHPRGVRRLLLLAAPSPAGYVSQRLADDAKLVLLRNPHGGVRALLDDCAACAVDALIGEAGGPPWDEAGFAALRRRVNRELNRATLGVITQVLPVLGAAHRVEQRLQKPAGPALAAARADLRTQLSELIYPGFIAETGWARLPHLRRYLEAMERRLDRLPSNPDRDLRLMEIVQDLQAEHDDLRAAGVADPVALEQVRWMIEELRVSFFAQALGTPYPVSQQRIERALDQLASA